MTTRQRTRSTSRAPRRSRVRYAWTNFTLTGTTLTDGGSVLSDLLGSFTIAEKEKVGTVLRVIWSWNVRAFTAGNLVSGRFGWIKVTDEAIAMNSVPGPSTDFGSSWMHNEFFEQEDAANVPAYLKGDSKSKRRLDGLGQSIAFVAESNGAASVGSAQFSFAGRILFSLK